jgi:hypothetical protein
MLSADLGWISVCTSVVEQRQIVTDLIPFVLGEWPGFERHSISRRI